MSADPDVPWDLVAQVRRSKRKTQIIHRLANDPASASELSTEFGIKTASISNLFRELKNTEPPLITCLTPDQPHHRIYGLTDDGEEVHTHL
jgi:DNA-binding HxlR family transcriptional regulator